MPENHTPPQSQQELVASGGNMALLTDFLWLTLTSYSMLLV